MQRIAEIHRHRNTYSRDRIYTHTTDFEKEMRYIIIIII